MQSLPDTLIIFDTEYTAWEGSQERGWSGENEYRELVQIGGVKVSNFKETDSILIYVTPTINPKLSHYFTELTNITQEEVDTKGVPYKDAQEQFYLWSSSLPIFSMHGGDEGVLNENAMLNSVPFPFDRTRFGSADELFALYGHDSKPYMSSTILTALGEQPLPNAHDALSDARSILKALQLASKRHV